MVPMGGNGGDLLASSRVGVPNAGTGAIQNLGKVDPWVAHGLQYNSCKGPLFDG